MITDDQLKKVLPHCPPVKLSVFSPFLLLAMGWAEINTPIRQAAFIAQLACESGEFRWMEEIADGSAYEGRRDLGNTQPGDGKRYKGRGPIQITGRANYKAAGDALGMDLIASPEKAASPEVGFRLAAWFWRSRGLNVLADSIAAVSDDAERAKRFDAITKKINGGTNGKALRDQYFHAACAVLGC